MTIKERLTAELDNAKLHVAELEKQLSELPAEIEHLAEEAWEKIKAFFKGL